MNKIVSASLDRIEYSSRIFLFPGPLPVSKGWLFYMSSLGYVMPNPTIFRIGSQIDYTKLSEFSHQLANLTNPIDKKPVSTSVNYIKIFNFNML